MRITDQYFWNVVFSIFFIALIAMEVIVLEGAGYKSVRDVTLFDIFLISLATFRAIRLFMYDKVTAFFREQFWDAKETKTKVILVKPDGGPRRTIADLMSCPWCFGLWAGASLTFFYFLTPYAFYLTLFLAISAIASMLQILANMFGWRAEQLKKDVEQ